MFVSSSEECGVTDANGRFGSGMWTVECGGPAWPRTAVVEAVVAVANFLTRHTAFWVNTI